MKMKRYAISLVLVSMLFTCISITGCNEPSKSSPPQKIVIDIGDEPATLDPQLATDLVSSKIVSYIFEGLYRKDKTGLPVPAIAQSCDISTDGLIYTFHLKDAFWADGTKIEANDFKNAWLRALDGTPKNYKPSEMASQLFPIKGAEEYNSGKGKPEDVGIKVTDPKTLVVTLIKPTPYFLDSITNCVFMPINKAFYDKQPNANNMTKYGSDSATIMGNGPFTIKEWKHDQDIVLEKNLNYINKGNIKLQTVTLKIYKNASAAFMAFKSNELDVVEITQNAQLSEVPKFNGVAMSYDTGAVFYAGLNTKDPSLNNIKIRKALSYSIDRDTLIKTVVKDDSIKALGFVNPVIYGSKDSFRKESGDLFKDNNIEEAKKLLSDGMKELKLDKLPKLKLLTEDKETAKRDAVAYAEIWRKNLGIEVEINTMPWNAIMEKLMSYDYQIALLSWNGSFNDPGEFLNIFASDNSFNVYQYSNKNVDELLKKTETETDKSKRMQQFIDVEKTVINDMVVIPLYFSKNSYAVKSKVKGLVRGSTAIQNMDLYWTYIE